MEIAANHRQKVHATPRELVEDLRPELWSAVQPADDVVRAEGSKRVALQIRATRKFVGFLTGCAPEPPELRASFGELDRAKTHCSYDV